MKNIVFCIGMSFQTLFGAASSSAPSSRSLPSSSSDNIDKLHALRRLAGECRESGYNKMDLGSQFHLRPRSASSPLRLPEEAGEACNWHTKMPPLPLAKVAMLKETDKALPHKKIMLDEQRRQEMIAGLSPEELCIYEKVGPVIFKQITDNPELLADLMQIGPDEPPYKFLKKCFDRMIDEIKELEKLLSRETDRLTMHEKKQEEDPQTASMILQLSPEELCICDVVGYSIFFEQIYRKPAILDALKKFRSEEPHGIARLFIDILNGRLKKLLKLTNQKKLSASSPRLIGSPRSLGGVHSPGIDSPRQDFSSPRTIEKVLQDEQASRFSPRSAELDTVQKITTGALQKADKNFRRTVSDPTMF